VAAYDLRAISEKGKLSDPSEYQALKMAKEEMQNQDEAIRKIFESFMEDPLSLGVDLSQELYSFYYSPDEDPGYLGVTGAITDRSALKENLKKMLEAAGVPGEVEPKKKEGRSYLKMGGTILIWDDSRLLFLSPNDRKGSQKEGVEKEAVRLMDAKGKETLVESNEDFQTFMERKKDISNWISVSDLPASVQKELDRVPMEGDSMVKGTTFHSYLAFKPDAVEFTHFTNNPKWEEKDAFQKVLKEGVDKKLLSFLPKETYMGAAVAFDPDAAYKMAQDAGEEDLQEMKKGLEKEQNIDMDKLVSSLSGDILLTVNGFGTYERTYRDFVQKDDGKGGGFGSMKAVEKTEEQIFPKTSLLVKTRTDYIHKQIEEKLLAHDSVEKVGDYYRIGMVDFPLYLGWKDDKTVFGSHEGVVQKLYDGGYASSSMADTEMGSLFAGAGSSASLILDLDRYPDKVRDYLKEGMIGPSKKAFESSVKILERVDAQSFEENGFKVTLKLKEADGNSLNTLLKQLDKNTGTIMRGI
jgi:hypothetical protein